MQNSEFLSIMGMKLFGKFAKKLIILQTSVKNMYHIKLTTLLY